MKLVGQEKPSFQPVTIQIESQGELNLLCALVGAVPYTVIEGFGNLRFDFTDLYNNLLPFATECPSLETIRIENGN